MPQVEKLAIHNRLLQVGKAGPYFAVVYDKNTGEAVAVDPDVTPTVDPKSCLCNETSASFDRDTRHGRDYTMDRVSWIWLLVLHFDQEVTTYEAEESWLTSPPRLAANAPESLRGARLELLNAEFTHPVKQDGHSGTLVRFFFEVRQNRR